MNLSCLLPNHRQVMWQTAPHFKDFYPSTTSSSLQISILRSHRCRIYKGSQTGKTIKLCRSCLPLAATILYHCLSSGLVSFVTMLGLTLRRALQPATIPTNSGGLGLDMPMMEMKSQDSHRMSSSRVGWGQLSSQNSRPSTLCYAMETQEMMTQDDLKSLAKQLNPTVGYWDPLSIGEESTSLWNYNNERKIAWFRQAEIKHGRVAMAAFVGYCVQANGGKWSFPT